MGRINFIFAIILISILLCPSLLLSTNISGDVFGVLSPENNPYLATGNLRVPPESTLIIEPGCQIIFQGHFVFLVDTSATLLAIGLHSDSIVFSAEDTLSGWLGLKLSHSSQFTKFRY